MIHCYPWSPSTGWTETSQNLWLCIFVYSSHFQNLWPSQTFKKMGIRRQFTGGLQWASTRVGQPNVRIFVCQTRNQDLADFADLWRFCDRTDMMHERTLKSDSSSLNRVKCWAISIRIIRGKELERIFLCLDFLRFVDRRKSHLQHPHNFVLKDLNFWTASSRRAKNKQGDLGDWRWRSI